MVAIVQTDSLAKRPAIDEAAAPNADGLTGSNHAVRQRVWGIYILKRGNVIALRRVRQVQWRLAVDQHFECAQVPCVEVVQSETVVVSRRNVALLVGDDLQVVLLEDQGCRLHGQPVSSLRQ